MLCNFSVKDEKLKYVNKFEFVLLGELISSVEFVFNLWLLKPRVYSVAIYSVVCVLFREGKR